MRRSKRRRTQGGLRWTLAALRLTRPRARRAQSPNEAARAGEQATRAGADIASQGAETLRDTMRSGLNTATETFQRASDQFLKGFTFSGPQSEEVARRSSQTIDAVTQTGSIMARGFQEVSHELLGLA